MFKNRSAQKVIEANYYVGLSHSNYCFKIFVWLNIHNLIH